MNLISRLKTESFARGMWLSVVFNILAKGILFLLTILLAAYFGSNIKTDIYFFVYGSMVLLAGFINAIDHAVLIPQSMRLRQSDGDAAAMAFLNYFFRIYIFIGLAFVVLMYFLEQGYSGGCLNSRRLILSCTEIIFYWALVIFSFYCSPIISMPSSVL